jgi:hypothetical protein
VFAAEAQDHELLVWADPGCSGLSDAESVLAIESGPDPAGFLRLEPEVIAGGQGSTLTWGLTAGSSLGGTVSHLTEPEIVGPSGSVPLWPANTTEFQLTLMTRQGGLARSATVWVDEVPPGLFRDGFESGDTSAWSAVVGGEF